MEMIDYIKEQPEVFAGILSRGKEITAPFVKMLQNAGTDHLYLIASGTSLNACLAAEPFMERVLGVEVSCSPASDLPQVYAKKPVLLFVSQSGNSTNTIAAIKEMHRRYPYAGIRTVAMTGNPQGAINTMCDAFIEIACGEETAGPKTKGYTSTILTLYLLALEGGKVLGAIDAEQYENNRKLLERETDLLKANIETAERWYHANEEGLGQMKALFAVGKNTGAAIAREASLKVLETTLVPAAPFEFEEYLHGPSMAIMPDLAGLYLFPEPGDADEERFHILVRYHRDMTHQVWTAGYQSSDDPRDLCLQGTGDISTTPFEQILPAQVIGALLPEKLGIGSTGHDHFKALDKALHMKVYR